MNSFNNNILYTIKIKNGPKYLLADDRNSLGILTSIGRLFRPIASKPILGCISLRYEPTIHIPVRFVLPCRLLTYGYKVRGVSHYILEVCALRLASPILSAPDASKRLNLLDLRCTSSRVSFLGRQFPKITPPIFLQYRLSKW